jgi:hypothetical protein
MKDHMTTYTAMMAEWQKTWESLISAWTKPAPVVDQARKAEQAAADKEWEDEGGTVKQPKAPAGETPPAKLPL